MPKKRTATTPKSTVTYIPWMLPEKQSLMLTDGVCLPTKTGRSWNVLWVCRNPKWNVIMHGVASMPVIT